MAAPPRQELHRPRPAGRLAVSSTGNPPARAALERLLGPLGRDGASPACRPCATGATVTPEEHFSGLVGDLDYPMMIVTAAAGGEKAGCLVGFATQCSIEPPLFAVWLSRKNHTFRVAQQADVLAVHFPSFDQASLAAFFGGETGDEVDKFSRCRWREGPRGAPVLEDCVRWFTGRVIEHIPTEDHVGFLLEPLEVASGPWPGQLSFQSIRHISPGHEA